MNKRIQELAEHCDFYVGNEHSDASFEEQQRLFLEKFAQLIVQECGQWIINNAGAMEHLGPEYFAKAMIKDFGVES